MRLVSASLRFSGPLERVEVPFADEEGQPRPLTVVHGGPGVGKTTLVQALASTRPGHAVTQLVRADGLGAAEQPPPQVACDWLPGSDDPGRPHVIRIASPNLRVLADDDAESLRRREQAYYDRLAGEGGFVFLGIPSARWFSRQPIALTAPLRGVARYDVRAPLAFEDASRADLTRDTKQALAYAVISEALAGQSALDEYRFDALAAAMRSAVDRLSELSGVRYLGIEPLSLEPVFAERSSKRLSFDALPTRTRHLVSFGALSVRALWAAYPAQDPRESEGVVVIDDVELHQDSGVLSNLPHVLREVLPHVQWVLTTTSSVLAASSAVSEVLALRRMEDGQGVSLFAGQAALTH